MITSIEKKFVEIYRQKHPESEEKTIFALMENNLIDFRTCKIALIRYFVHDCVKRGCGKREAMRLIADDMACSYEYVRKVMYYYNDINI
ncbi:MAG: hypothetical protein FWF54_08550 [Candidatus Azobacteroides sp.]|nr:hypothetical protein [Candidatus Azobacteroides sp.]